MSPTETFRKSVKWEVTLTTLISGAGFLIVFLTLIFGWGAVYQRVDAGQQTNAEDISLLENRVSQIEADRSRLDAHDMQIAMLDRRTEAAAGAMRSVEQALSNLSADMRVTREILERIERMQGSRSIPPTN